MLFPSIRSLRSFLLHILHSPAGKFFLFSLFCWLLSFVYCRHRFWRDPHSAFFQSDTVYDQNYSALRAAQADAFISASSLPNVALHKAVASPKLCAAFVTVRREPKQYIDQAIGSMLEGLSDQEREDLFVLVLFANGDPSVHPTWNATWLRAVVDLATTYEVGEEELAHLREMEEKYDFQQKGIIDYTYALDKCYETNAPYIAMFEDDIIFADGWLAKTQNALKEIELQDRKGREFNDWIYLRLFYTETYLGWHGDDFWYSNRYNAVLFLAIIAGLILLGTRTLFPSTKRTLDGYAIGVICLIAVPAFTALFFMIGKTSLFPLHGVVEMNKYGCCTQGLVFPRRQVPGITQYLREMKSGQTDLLLEEYATAKDKQRLALGEQQIQHVGLVSSRGMDKMGTQSVWAFLFEENDPKRLRIEHQRLLEET